MENVAINKVESSAFGRKSKRCGLSEHLGTTDLSLNRYRIAPGDGFPGGLHAHMDQEEVFVVTEGTATFETMDGEVTVRETEAIRFGPGEFQSGKNESDNELVAFAMGAPRDTEDLRIPVACPECSHDHLCLEFSEDELTFVCPDCEATHVPRACLECGHDDLRLTLGEATQTVVVCQNCGAEFESPPLQE